MHTYTDTDIQIHKRKRAWTHTKKESERQQEENSDLMTLCVLEEHRAEELALDARKLVIDKRAHNTQHSHAQQLLDGTAAESATHNRSTHTTTSPSYTASV